MFLTGVTLGILNTKHTKTANEKGVSPVFLTAKCAETPKVCMVCFSLFVPFPLFAVHRIQREYPL